MIKDGLHRDCITSLYDRVSCFVQLGNVMSILRSEKKDIANLVSSAIEKFEGTPQLFRVLKFKSGLLLQDNDVAGALQVFDKISRVRFCLYYIINYHYIHSSQYILHFSTGLRTVPSFTDRKSRNLFAEKA